ncbi:MAG: 30S ribosomal protein S16 [Candidatus Uhrbacteria bacterium]
MLVIRLTRVGKIKQPSYRIVLQEKQRDPWGKHQELLGRYNPRTKPSTIELREDRITYWIKRGAQPSDTVWNLLVDRGIVTGPKRRSSGISKKRRAKLDLANKSAASPTS